MGGAGKRLDRRLDGVQRGLHQAPLAPAAFYAPGGEGHGGVVRQTGADTFIGLAGGAGIEMDRDEIARRRQALGLGNDAIGVFVAQKDVGDSCHDTDSRARKG